MTAVCTPAAVFFGKGKNEMMALIIEQCFWGTDENKNGRACAEDGRIIIEPLSESDKIDTNQACIALGKQELKMLLYFLENYG